MIEPTFKSPPEVRPKSAIRAALFAVLLGPIGMVYSTLVGCVVMMLGGGLLTVAYVAYDNPWDTGRPGYDQAHSLLAPAVWATVIVYWLGCIVWAVAAVNPSPRLNRAA